MLDDRQLENLVRMAAEIEAIEALASKQPPLRLAGQPAATPERRLRLSWRKSAVFGSVAAAAAAIAFVLIPSGVMTASHPGTKSDAELGAVEPNHPDLWSGQDGVWPGALPWPFNGEPVITEASADGIPQSLRKPDIRGALLAILQDDSGQVESVKWVEHDWDDGSTLAETKASDLVALSLMMSVDRTPRQMTVVGLRGPADELPLGDARAAELASCILKAPARCSSMTCCNPGAATECIPEDVAVRFEKVSFR